MKDQHHLQPDEAQEHADHEFVRESRKIDKAVIDSFAEHYLLAVCNASKASTDWLSIIAECYRVSGGPDTNNKLRAARALFKKAWPQIEQGLRAKLNGAAPLGLQVLIDLAINAKQESVKLKAATELLNKAGFGEAMRLEVTQKVEELSDEELQQQIRAEMEKNGLRAVEA